MTTCVVLVTIIQNDDDHDAGVKVFRCDEQDPADTVDEPESYGDWVSVAAKG